MRLRSLAVAATAAAGALAFAAAPASATPVVPWGPLTVAPGETIICGPDAFFPTDPGISYSTCILDKNGTAQAVLAVTSRSATPVTVLGEVRSVQSGWSSAADCDADTLSPGQTLICTGPAGAVTATPTQLPWAKLTVDGVQVSYTP
ncbi:hypothetical protein ACH41E_01485 [Streptomyces sp. NPDC020412]|uniref:hypothetical protein n=1 Tax=Streptomyces sp. NPDC020412 TaxID=3365073 RepID=UPI0037B294F7